jgi:hypothetical protein
MNDFLITGFVFLSLAAIPGLILLIKFYIFMGPPSSSSTNAEEEYNYVTILFIILFVCLVICIPTLVHGANLKGNEANEDFQNGATQSNPPNNIN